MHILGSKELEKILDLGKIKRVQTFLLKVEWMCTIPEYHVAAQGRGAALEMSLLLQASVKN